jgi:hypothetical protein
MTLRATNSSVGLDALWIDLCAYGYRRFSWVQNWFLLKLILEKSGFLTE